MARIHSRSGPRISALPDARPYYDRAMVRAMGDRGFGADTRERGDFLSVRCEWAFLDEDTLKEQVLWIPFADANCVFDEDTMEFTVIGGPRDPRAAQYFLSQLDKDEKIALMADLKRV